MLGRLLLIRGGSWRVGASGLDPTSVCAVGVLNDMLVSVQVTGKGGNCDRHEVDSKNSVASHLRHGSEYKINKT
jgi:hypothetical protein